ncbi:MAG: hydrogenase maturation protease [Bacteroidales bacterium]|nr:hydrogenase maturation protease [Bacteroidales bacterium]
MSDRILIYGIGNPGRQDDALGILLVDKLDAWLKENPHVRAETDQNYQLNIEDADRIADFDRVVFVDASVHDIESTLLEKIVPDFRSDFSMHYVEPSFVVGLCHQVFDRKPACYQLHIKAYEFEFMKPLTEGGKKNLEIAFKEILDFLQQAPMV